MLRERERNAEGSKGMREKGRGRRHNGGGRKGEGMRGEERSKGEWGEALRVSLGEGSHLREGGQKGTREGVQRNIQRKGRIEVIPKSWIQKW